MIRVIVRNGRLEPLEPLPGNWNEGTELSIEMAMPSDSPVATANWQQQFEEMEAHAAQVSPEDMDELNAILDENDRQQKELVRRQWNLTPCVITCWTPIMSVRRWLRSHPCGSVSTERI